MRLKPIKKIKHESRTVSTLEMVLLLFEGLPPSLVGGIVAEVRQSTYRKTEVRSSDRHFRRNYSHLEQSGEELHRDECVEKCFLSAYSLNLKELRQIAKGKPKGLQVLGITVTVHKIKVIYCQLAV